MYYRPDLVPTSSFTKKFILRVLDIRIFFYFIINNGQAYSSIYAGEVSV